MENKNKPKPESVDGQPTCRKRGRPKKEDGMRIVPLDRDMVALFNFHRARSAGSKFDSAVHEAAKEIGISVSAMKRILTEYQPKDALFGMTVDTEFQPLPEAIAQRNKALGLPEAIWKDAKVVTFGIRPVPKYPRANARKRR